MTTPPGPIRPTPPTAAEIVALMARLRDISARGRDVDADERAQFLADKDDLIARITATGTDAAATDPGPDGPVMPDWIRRQARETEAAIAAGTSPAPSTDDAAAVAQRLAEFGAAQGTSDGPTALRQAPRAVDVDAVRREQLTRWHAEEQSADAADAAPTLVRGEDQ